MMQRKAVGREFFPTHTTPGAALFDDLLFELGVFIVAQLEAILRDGKPRPIDSDFFALPRFWVRGYGCCFFHSGSGSCVTISK